jgi:hypothetical protein
MIKKGIICETLGTTDKLQINESKNGEIRLTGVFGVCGVKNNNNRVYEKKNYGECINEMQQRIVSEGILGELEHPNSGNINLNNVSHKIESIQMNEDGTIVGTILLLNTAKGKDAKAIVEGGVPLFISSRASGSIDAAGRVNLNHIQTYDLVGTPGFSQARLNLAESQIGQTVCLNESLDGQNGMYMIVESEEVPDDINEGDLAVDKKPTDDKSVDEKPADEKPADEKPAYEKPTDEKPADEKPADEKQADEKPADDTYKKDMMELKTLIKDLARKVDSLESQLHVAQEALQIQDEMIGNLKESQIKPEVLQNWLIEEFAPEVQNWVVEEFAPEVQNWVVEEFAPEVQNWVVEEFAPEVQNWIVEEYSPEVQNWIVEEYSPEHLKLVNEAGCGGGKRKKNVEEDEEYDTVKAGDKKTKEVVTDKATGKPVCKDGKKSCVSESYILNNMPSKYKSVWESLSDGDKKNIIDSSKLYNFNSHTNIIKFWESKLATDKVNDMKAAQLKMLTESMLNRSSNVVNPRYAAIFNKAKAMQLR